MGHIRIGAPVIGPKPPFGVSSISPKTNCLLHQAVKTESIAIVKNDFVAVVIPCYRVTRQVLDVIARIGPEFLFVQVAAAVGRNL